MYEYYKTHYVPEKMLVVVSGGFDKEKVEKIIGNTFAKFEKQKVPSEPLL
ncbi:MAG: insulinase family protein, partial [Endomicrobium sp.]|nr:insulinase family protein [Endomicrobium sp.]